MTLKIANDVGNMGYVIKHVTKYRVEKYATKYAESLRYYFVTISM